MSENQVQEARQDGRWRRAPELPPDVFAVLHKADRAINPIAVVATVEADGAPRTAPFGSLRAVTPGASPPPFFHWALSRFSASSQAGRQTVAA